MVIEEGYSPRWGEENALNGTSPVIGDDFKVHRNKLVRKPVKSMDGVTILSIEPYERYDVYL